MTVKSVLDIELNAAAFDKFAQQFQKYQDALTKGPKFWRDVAKEQKASVASFQKMTEAMAAQAGMQRRLTDTYKSQNQHLMQGERLWGSMATHAKGISSSIISATRSLLSWTGILSGIGGLLGAGSLFGIDRMARAVSGERSTAMGLGMSIGQKKAFDITFGARGINSDAFLSWISQMEVDPSKIGPAAGLGVGLTGNTNADAIAMLRAIRAQALADPSNMGMLPKKFGLEAVGVENIRQMAGMSNQEFEGQASEELRLSTKLNIGDPTAEKWQDFLKRLDEAKSSIFKTFVEGLKPLADPLIKLSGAFENFLNTILRKDGIAEQAINKLAGWLDDFSGKISKPEFLKSVEEFTSGVGAMAQAMSTLLDRVSNPSATLEREFAGRYGAQGAIVSRWMFNMNPTQRAYTDKLSVLEQTYKLPKGILAYEAMKESGMDLSGKYNTPNAKGAVGTFQLTPAALKEIYEKANFKIDPTDPLQSALGAAVYNRIQQDRFGADVRKMLGAYNWGPENMDAYARTGRGARGQQIPAETRDYIGGARISGSGSDTTITIINATGGAAVPIVSAMPY